MTHAMKLTPFHIKLMRIITGLSLSSLSAYALYQAYSTHEILGRGSRHALSEEPFWFFTLVCVYTASFCLGLALTYQGFNSHD